MRPWRVASLMIRQEDPETGPAVLSFLCAGKYQNSEAPGRLQRIGFIAIVWHVNRRFESRLEPRESVLRHA